MKNNISNSFNRLVFYFVAVSSFTLVTACEVTPVHTADLTPSVHTVGALQSTPPKKEVAPTDDDLHPAPSKQPGDLWRRIRHDLTWQSVDNPRIDQQRDALLQQPSYLPMIAERADYYLYYIVEQVEKRGMPMEIALVPMVESTLDPFASSHSGAAGLWQIMPSTGEHMGLEQNTWYDGRQALRDSTDAALDYLQYLHDEFDGDWFLALAAYNAGEGTIARSQQLNWDKGLDTDYWSLKLRRQARDYVPKIIALTQIVAAPREYDTEIPYVADTPAFEVASTGNPLRLSQAAQITGVELDILRALNPGQLRGAISPERPAELLVPAGTGYQFEAKLAQLDPEALVPWQTYRVRRGDNLWQIAAKFDTDVAAIRQANNISGSDIQIGDVLRVPGSDHLDTDQYSQSAEETGAKGYLVRAGDSLIRIANKFNVSVGNIINWNNLDPDQHLHPGQKLTLHLGGG